MKGALTIKEIQAELGCSPNHARALVLREMRSYNIAERGSRPAWRVRRKDFEDWLASRERKPDLERIAAFSRKYMK